jgi:hypothetical protein
MMLLASALTGQKPVTIVYQGTLTDMEGDIISDKQIRADLSFLDDQGNSVYSVIEESRISEYGTFDIAVEDIPEWISDDNTYRIRITLHNTAGENWLLDGTFDLDYTLTAEKTGSTYTYILKRFEGLILEARSEGQLWQFNDLYPFAYLSSRFMISFNSDISEPEDVEILCNEFFNTPGEGEDAMKKAAPAAQSEQRSRGLKGGYAVGGYQDDDDD